MSENNEEIRGERLPDRSPNGSVDNLVAGLSTLTPRDLQDLKNRLDPSTTDPDKEILDKSPHTRQYLKIVRAIYGNTIGGLYGNEKTSGKSLTRAQLYAIYDEMDETTAYITSALDILSDDATQPDDDGKLLYVESPNAKVKTVLENLFESLEIESRLSKWARAVAKYGDLFIRVYGSTEDGDLGVSSIEDNIYPSQISRRDYKGKLVAFVEEGMKVYSDESYLPPWTYIHFRHKGELVAVHSRDALGEDAIEMSSSYGQSILRAAIKVYTQLRFVENMILLSRLTNSVRRNIFSINVGEVDPARSFEIIKNYSDLLKKDINLDLDESIYNSAKHTAVYDEDIFLPVSDPKNDVNITTVGGDTNIAEQYDLDYLQNKLFAALKIPKAYLNYEQDLNARSTLIQLDIRYARSVSQLQQTLVSGLTRLANIHLAYIGIDPDSVDFNIYLTNVSAIDQEARLEQKSARIAAANDFWSIVEQVNSTLRDARDDQEQQQEKAQLNIDTPDIDTSSQSSSDEFPPSSDSEPSPETIDTGELEAPVSDSPDSIEAIKDTLRASAPEGKRYRGSKRLQESSDPLSNVYESPINLTYLARRLFSDYLDFSEDEVDVIFGTRKDIKEESRRLYNRRTTIRSIADDSEISYPTKDGKRLYEATKSIMLEAIRSSMTDPEDPDDIDDGE